MGLWDGIKRQLRSVIAWENPAEDDLFYRWSDNGEEIKNASKLIVGPGQGCIFVYEGRVVAVHEREGMTSLLTQNIPFWTTVKKVMQAFESEHKVGLYFYKRTEILNQKWGTRAPIKYVDPVYDIPVALLAFGNYSFRITDPKHFFVNIIGGKAEYGIGAFRDAMVARLVQPISDFLAESKYSYTQIDAQRDEIAIALHGRLNAVFSELGFLLSDFRIEGTDFDEGTQARINRIADVGADVHAAKNAGISYRELQRLSAMRDAATNEVGAAGMMMGMGTGMHLANETNPAAPAEDIGSKLRQLKQFFDDDLITEEEYSAKKSELLKRM
jgi:membrane protease subunit (stomatin/prohibitin family)